MRSESKLRVRVLTETFSASLPCSHFQSARESNTLISVVGIDLATVMGVFMIFVAALYSLWVATSPFGLCLAGCHELDWELLAGDESGACSPRNAC